MNSHFSIFIVVNCFFSAYSEISELSCTQLKTYGYGYKDFYHINELAYHNASSNSLLFKFFVQASSDAHILLSPIKEPTSYDPVYEIVLGAGKNTFSVIRRRQRTGSRASATTEGILSVLEPREFWVNISSDGIIQVGKGGDDFPILYWQDPVPLRIHFFSFCTWGSTLGKWLFDCNSEAEIEHIARTLTPLQRLRSDLLTHYDPYSRPVLNDADVIPVFMHIACTNIDIDEKKSILTLQGKISMHWIDQKLQWNPVLYENLTELHLLHEEVWRPEVVLYNAFGKDASIFEPAPILVNFDGSVQVLSATKLKSFCHINLRNWPNDQQNCELQFGFWSQDQFLQMHLLENGTRISKQSVSKWKVVNLTAETNWISSSWSPNITDSDYADDVTSANGLRIHLVLERQSKILVQVFSLPFLVVATMTILSFWISPLEYIRMLLSCLSLILLSIFVVTLGLILPAPAAFVPKLLHVYSYGMIAVSIALVITTFAIRVSRYHQLSPLPKVLYRVIASKVVQYVLYIPPIL